MACFWVILAVVGSMHDNLHDNGDFLCAQSHSSRVLLRTVLFLRRKETFLADRKGIR